MKKMTLLTLGIWMAVLLVSSSAFAGPDLYRGDSSIYGGTPAMEPNVLIILDTSGSMSDESVPGTPYAGQSTAYTSNGCGAAPCPANHVYKCTAWGPECGNWVDMISDVNTVTTTCGGSNPKTSLLTTGIWNSSSKALSNIGTCVSGNGIYATGNYINWLARTSGAFRPKIDIAKEVVTNLVLSTFGVKFGLMRLNNSQGGKFMQQTVLGAPYTTTIKDMNAVFTGTTTTTNRFALVDSVSQLTANDWTPLAETLFESMRYFQGGASAFANTEGITNGVYTSPITADYQKNFVIIITDGMSTQDSDNVLKTICNAGDCDGDGLEPANDPAKNYSNGGSDYLDDVAWYMYHKNMKPSMPGSNVTVYVVGFGLGGADYGAVKLLNETAANGAPLDKNGNPRQAFMPNDEASLTSSLQTIMNDIFDVNASFAAPAKIGVFQDGMWYLDKNQSWDWNDTPTDILGTFGIGLDGAVPVVGDWTGDGKTKIGVYINGEWYLDMNNNWQWDGEGVDVHGVFGVGLPNAIPVTGDWNGDGITEIGIFSEGNWYLDKNHNWAWDGEPTDTHGVFGIGLPNAIPVTGDWNGDGKTEIGIYSEGQWYLDKNQSWAWEGEPADTYGVFGVGLTNAIPVTGDWNGDGFTKIGIYNDGYWYLDTSKSWAWDGTPTDTLGVFGIGLGTVVPVTGNW